MCGRVNAFQRGSTDAFYPALISGQGLEGYYVDAWCRSPSHMAMELQAHVNTSEHLLQHSMKMIPATVNIGTVPAQTLMKTGLIKSLHLLETITSVILAAPGLDIALLEYIHGMVRCGPTNTCCRLNNPHGSAPHFQNPHNR